MTPRRRTGLYLDEELLAGLDALKQRDGIPASEAVRRALADYLRKRGIRLRTLSESLTELRGSAKPKRQKGTRA